VYPLNAAIDLPLRHDRSRIGWRSSSRSIFFGRTFPNPTFFIRIPPENGYNSLGFARKKRGVAVSRRKNKGQNQPQNQPQPAPETPDQPAEPEIPDDIEEFLSDFSGKGFKAQLYRNAPLNCCGFLETYPLDDNLSLEAIKESWGGRDFSIRIKNPRGKVVEIRSFKIADVPRVNGVPLSKHIEYTRGGQQIKHDPSNDLMKGMQAQIEAANKRHEDLMLKMMDMSANHAAELRKADRDDRKNTADPMDQMRETFALFNEMKEFTDKHGGEGGTEGIDYGEMFKLFREELSERRAENRERENKRPPLKLPGSTQTTTQTTTQTNQTPAQPAQTVQAVQTPEPEDEDEITLSEELAGLGPEGAAEVVADVLNQFSPLEQKAAIDALMKAAEPAADPAADESLDVQQNVADTSP